MFEYYRIHNKADLKEWLSSEKSKYGFDKGMLHYVLQYVSCTENSILWRFQRLLRYAEYHTNTNHRVRKVYYRIKLNKVSAKYCLHIGVNVCGKGLRIMHVGPILVNPRVRMGENIVIHMNTSFVAQGTTDDVPEIGNDVVIGTGATVLGGVKIADGIAIGANALVNKSFEIPGIAIAGVPAKKISDNGRYSWNRKTKFES